MEKKELEIGRKALIAVFVLGFALIMEMGLASAVFWACFDKGQVIDYCNPNRDDVTCGSDIGCVRCMSAYLEEGNCFAQGNINLCNGLSQDCSTFGDDGEVVPLDTTPPELILYSPVNGVVYDERSILVEFDLNEESDVFYLENHESNPRWRRWCNNCGDYSRMRSFDEGQNDISIRATDVVGLESFYEVSFFVDSSDPRISRTEPRRGYASGVFSVEFREDNPVYVAMYYGNSETGERIHEIDVDSQCIFERRRFNCETFVDVSDYDGQEISYWFEVEDIAGAIDASREVSLDVDTTFPEFEVDYVVDGRYVELVLSVVEENFDEATYEITSNDRPRERRLCSRLREGICEKRVRLNEGTHNLDVRVYDDAGNAAAESLVIAV
jgi:hypothetical protein